MLTFKKLPKNSVNKIMDFVRQNNEKTCDYSQGVIFMWYDHFRYEYTIYNDMLILKVGDKSSPTFFPPLGNGDFWGAVSEIEKYCVENEYRIRFAFLAKETADAFCERYNGYAVKTGYNRNFSDYIYLFEDIKNFKGKRYNGQRNHINNFKKAYPDYQYKKITKKDIPRIVEFLKEYKTQHKKMKGIEKTEYLNTVKLVENYRPKDFVGGYLQVNGKIVAFSIGEFVKDTLIIHIEKGLTEYKGVYPTMFNEFARHNEKDGVVYINREDDSGDLGLRTSKMQYRPCCMQDKHFVMLNSFMCEFEKPTLKGQTVTLSPIKKADAKNYYKLNAAVKNNKMWGFDYKKFNKKPTEDYFYKTQKEDFKNKHNLCLAIREKGTTALIGEVVLYNFDFNGFVEVGIRLFEKAQGKGYAKESISLISNFVKQKLNLKLKAKCYKQNEKSRKLFESSGFKVVCENTKFYYFEKN